MFQKSNSVTVGLHDSLRANGAFSKLLNENTVTLCSWSSNKKEPYKIYLNEVIKVFNSYFFTIIIYLQLADVATLIHHLNFIINFRKGLYKETSLGSGNFKVIQFVFYTAFNLLSSPFLDSFFGGQRNDEQEKWFAS